MDSSSISKQFTIDELIILMYKKEPMLYDKSLTEFHTEYRDGRKNYFDLISLTIFQVFQKEMGGMCHVYFLILLVF